MTTTNPLLDFSDLPRFDLVRPEHVKPAIESLLTAGRELVVRLTADTTPPTWRDFAGALADGLEPFGRAWGVVGHLHSVNDVPAWREAYNEMLPEVSRFYAELGQNLALFARYKALRESPEYATLSPARQRILDNEIRDFRLSGAELADAQKPRFQAIQEELAALGASSRKTCSTRPTPSPNSSPTKPRSPGCPPTSNRRRAKPQKKTVSRAGSSRCTCRPICR